MMAGLMIDECRIDCLEDISPLYYVVAELVVALHDSLLIAEVAAMFSGTVVLHGVEQSWMLVLRGAIGNSLLKASPMS
jgi:hypothetical protein